MHDVLRSLAEPLIAARPRRRPTPGRTAAVVLGALGALVAVLGLCSACSSTQRPAQCGDAKNSSRADALGTPPIHLSAARKRERSQFVTRSGAQLELDGKPWRFTGVNMYWLGLDDNVTDDQGPTYPTHAAVDNGFCAAVELGAAVVRSTSLGVSVGSPRSLEPTLGHFNAQAFKSIDYAVADARRYGVRLMIPLTDQAHYYGGGKHTFTNWLGYPDIAGQTVSSSPAQAALEYHFYTDPKVTTAFDAYVQHLLDHVNPLTGIKLGDDPTIAAWETGNEVYDAPTFWTEQTAQFIKSQAPHALVADGSAASGKDITQTGVDQGDVDIVDGHFYPTNIAKARSDAAYVAGRQKVYVVGEYPMTGSDPRAWLAALAGDHNVDGDLAWSLLPYGADGRPEQHNDGYTFHYPGTNAEEKRIDALLRQHARTVAR